jgi:hypothetical protein
LRSARLIKIYLQIELPQKPFPIVANWASCLRRSTVQRRSQNVNHDRTSRRENYCAGERR